MYVAAVAAAHCCSADFVAAALVIAAAAVNATLTAVAASCFVYVAEGPTSQHVQLVGSAESAAVAASICTTRAATLRFVSVAL